MRSFQPKNIYTKEQTTSLKPLDVDIRMVFSIASPVSSGGVILEQNHMNDNKNNYKTRRIFFN